MEIIEIKIGEKSYSLSKFTMGDLLRLETLFNKTFIQLTQSLDSVGMIGKLLFYVIDKASKGSFASVEELLENIESARYKEIGAVLAKLFGFGDIQEEGNTEGKPLVGTGKKSSSTPSKQESNLLNSTI